MRPRTPPARSPSSADPLEALHRGAQRILGRALTDQEAGLFHKYLNLLVKWQSYRRLLGSSDPLWIVREIFLDSLLFLKVLPGGVQSVVDFGSGAGVPGIPLKLVRPDLRLTLVEARQSRASFLSTAVRELGLSETIVVSTRLEEVTRDLAERFDAVVARCSGNVGRLFGIGAHLVRPGGIVVGSGPPTEHPLPVGRWVGVTGIEDRGIRRFAVYERPV